MQCNIIIMHPITVLLHMYSTIQFSILHAKTKLTFSVFGWYVRQDHWTEDGKL